MLLDDVADEGRGGRRTNEERTEGPQLEDHRSGVRRKEMTMETWAGNRGERGGLFHTDTENNVWGNCTLSVGVNLIINLAKYAGDPSEAVGVGPPLLSCRQLTRSTYGI